MDQLTCVCECVFLANCVAMTCMKAVLKMKGFGSRRSLAPNTQERDKSVCVRTCNIFVPIYRLCVYKCAGFFRTRRIISYIHIPKNLEPHASIHIDKMG